jgi:hypothetical protein
MVSCIDSFAIQPPFYRETTVTLAAGVSDWEGIWSNGTNTTPGILEIDDYDAPGPPYTNDMLSSGIIAFTAGVGAGKWSSGSPLPGRQIVLGLNVTSNGIDLYINRVYYTSFPIPSGTVNWVNNSYTIMQHDVGFSWVDYPFSWASDSITTVRRVEYFAPSSNTSYVVPPSPPVPVITWIPTYVSGKDGGIPVGTTHGTIVATLSGANGGTFSLIPYLSTWSGLAVSGSNLVVNGTLSTGSFQFYVKAIDVNGIPGIAPKRTVTIF